MAFVVHPRRPGYTDRVNAKTSFLSWASLPKLPAFAVLLGALLVHGCGPNSTSPSNDVADLILQGGRVYTLAWGEPDAEGVPAEDAPHSSEGWTPDAEAIAIRGDRILFVGSQDEVSAYRGETTRVIDLAGATVVPGMVDSHTHVAGLGAKLERVDLLGVETEEEAVERVVVRAQEVPPGEWIVGWGWDEGAWAENYPDLRLLSERVPDHPVVMQSLHGFAVWGNRLALERAGIDAQTPSPSGGEIRQGADGEPTGLLLNRATPLLMGAVPAATQEQIQARIVAGLEEMARSGYVAVHEAGVDGELLEALTALAAEKRLPLRVYAMISARDEKVMRASLAYGPDGVHEHKLTVRSVKAYYDGALGSRGARLLADYSDRPGHRGVSGGEYGFDEDLVAELMKAGFQVGIHAIGDAGNRETLDFLQRVAEEHPESRNGRHRIEHAQVVHPEDFPRFAALGLIASMQPPHAVEDKAWAEDRLGEKRIHGAYAWRTLRRQGSGLIFNSDLAGSDHSLFYGLHSAITRRGKDLQPNEGWYAEEAVTAEEALRAYTNWPARAAFWEDETGVLAPGRWADLTVLDVDPLVLGETEPEKLLEGSVLLTVVAGEVVYEGTQADQK